MVNDNWVKFLADNRASEALTLWATDRAGAVDVVQNAPDGGWSLWTLLVLSDNNRAAVSSIALALLPLLEAETTQQTGVPHDAGEVLLTAVRAWAEDAEHDPAGLLVAEAIDLWIGAINEARRAAIAPNPTAAHPEFHYAAAALQLSRLCLAENKHMAASAAQSFLSAYLIMRHDMGKLVDAAAMQLESAAIVKAQLQDYIDDVLPGQAASAGLS
jgi:hypothetical protein